MAEPYLCGLFTMAVDTIKEHDKEQTAFMEKIQSWYPHLPQAKIKAMCNYILRHKEATGKALDDMQIYQQLYEITTPAKKWQ